jgi:hypothetical protein
VKRIPKSLQLYGHTVTVRVVKQKDWEALTDEYEEMEDSCGWWVPSDNLIVLLRQPRSLMLHTLFHELTHAVLYYMNDPRWQDEKYVDQMGALWAQALATAR